MASPSDLAGKRILVTGASGFTGRYVVAELKAQGCHVIGLGVHGEAGGDWASSLMPIDEYRQADLRQTASLCEVLAECRPDMIVHLGALAFVAHGRAEDFYGVNLLGTRNLLQAIDDAGIVPQRILLASSANIYGNSSTDLLGEDAAPAPANDYAVSKLAMEYVASLWRPRLPIVTVRPFNYTGRGQAENFLIPKIVSHFARRASRIELGNLDVARDFGDVRAVAESYRRLLQTPAAIGRTVNVCSGTTHSLRDIIALCEDSTGHSMNVVVNPAFVRPNEVKVLRGDNRLLKDIIGDWSCPPLGQTLDWMLRVA